MDEKGWKGGKVLQVPIRNEWSPASMLTDMELVVGVCTTMIFPQHVTGEWLTMSYDVRRVPAYWFKRKTFTSTMRLHAARYEIGDGCWYTFGFKIYHAYVITV